MEATGASVPFSLEPILVYLEGGRYIGPILAVSPEKLVAERRPAGRGAPKSGGDGGSRTKKTSPKVAATGGTAQVKARYDAHLPYLSFWDGENLRSIFVGAVLPKLYGNALCKNWNLCRVCWEDCDRKKMYIPTPPP